MNSDDKINLPKGSFRLVFPNPTSLGNTRHIIRQALNADGSIELEFLGPATLTALYIPVRNGGTGLEGGESR